MSADLILPGSGRVTVAGPAVGEVVESGTALIAEVSFKSCQAMALPGNEITLVGGRSLWVTLALLAPAVRMVVPGSLGTLLTSLTLREWRANASTSVWITNVARFFTGKAFWKEILSLLGLNFNLLFFCRYFFIALKCFALFQISLSLKRFFWFPLGDQSHDETIKCTHDCSVIKILE